MFLFLLLTLLNFQQFVDLVKPVLPKEVKDACTKVVEAINLRHAHPAEAAAIGGEVHSGFRP